MIMEKSTVHDEPSSEEPDMRNIEDIQKEIENQLNIDAANSIIASLAADASHMGLVNDEDGELRMANPNDSSNYTKTIDITCAHDVTTKYSQHNPSYETPQLIGFFMQMDIPQDYHQTMIDGLNTLKSKINVVNALRHAGEIDFKAVYLEQGCVDFIKPVTALEKMLRVTYPFTGNSLDTIALIDMFLNFIYLKAEGLYDGHEVQTCMEYGWERIIPSSMSMLDVEKFFSNIHERAKAGMASNMQISTVEDRQSSVDDITEKIYDMINVKAEQFPWVLGKQIANIILTNEMDPFCVESLTLTLGEDKSGMNLTTRHMPDWFKTWAEFHLVYLQKRPRNIGDRVPVFLTDEMLEKTVLVLAWLVQKAKLIQMNEDFCKHFTQLSSPILSSELIPDEDLVQAACKCRQACISKTVHTCDILEFSLYTTMPRFFTPNLVIQITQEACHQPIPSEEVFGEIDHFMYEVTHTEKWTPFKAWYKLHDVMNNAGRELGRLSPFIDRSTIYNRVFSIVKYDKENTVENNKHLPSLYSCVMGAAHVALKTQALAQMEALTSVDERKRQLAIFNTSIRKIHTGLMNFIRSNGGIQFNVFSAQFTAMKNMETQGPIPKNKRPAEEELERIDESDEPAPSMDE
jgi:uncharacterized protein YqiB (DUF1249 family)